MDESEGQIPFKGSASFLAGSAPLPATPTPTRPARTLHQHLKHLTSSCALLLGLPLCPSPGQAAGGSGTGSRGVRDRQRGGPGQGGSTAVSLCPPALRPGCPWYTNLHFFLSVWAVPSLGHELPLPGVPGEAEK